LHAFFQEKKERLSDARASQQKWVALASSLATCWSFVLHLRQYLYDTKTVQIFLLGFWSGMKCLQFIEDYRLCAELWHSTDKDYKNKQKRTDALQKLAQKFSSDSKSILKKIKSLRSYFHKEHSNVINKKSGSGADGVFSSSWFAYKQLLFILESDFPRTGRDTINNNDVNV
jgi:hypothetical protein